MADLVVLGGINMDLVVRAPAIPRPGETLQGSGFARFGGGKGANQALAAARLGAAVALLGQVGADPFGEELLAGLQAEGVGTRGVRRLAGQPTGVACIVVAGSGENAIVVSPGANMAWDDAGLGDVAARASAGRLLAANLEVPAGVVSAAVGAARRAGATVILNPAPYRKGDEACFAGVDVLVPNQIEAAEFAGLDPAAVRDWAEVGRRLLALGPRAVVVTLGEEGALVVQAAGAVRLPGHRVPVVDTTAAGDAFVGGLAAALLRGEALLDAVRYANACGAVAVTRPGAQPSLPTAEAVERLLGGQPHRQDAKHAKKNSD
ncbi:MAG: ribokinase [Candidatus Methylomirabilales bacterium]